MRWFEHEENKVRGYWLKAPYGNVFVGCDPLDGMTKISADSFDVYVNVSDSPCETFEPSRPGQHMHWYPVNELGRWNLSYLYWLVKVLDHHHAAGHKVYLHCHAGAYRSPSAAVLWLQSRGHSPEEALTLGKESGSSLYKLWENHGNIPDRKDEVFELMREHPSWALAAVLHETNDDWNHEVISGYARRLTLLHRYLWFYYRPKWALKDAWQRFVYWAFKRYGYHREGIGTSYYRRKRFWARPKDAEPLDPNEGIVYGKRWDPVTRAWREEPDA